MKAIVLATTLALGCGGNSFAQSRFTVANGPASAITCRGGPFDGIKINSVGPDKYWAQLYIGLDSSSLAPVATAIAPIGVNDTVANGLFNFGTVTIPGLDAGNTVLLQVRGWLGNKTSGGSDAAAIKGENQPKPFTSRISPPVVAFGPGGLGGFQIGGSCVPEPGGGVLVSLGMASLLVCRRRRCPCLWR